LPGLVGLGGSVGLEGVTGLVGLLGLAGLLGLDGFVGMAGLAVGVAETIPVASSPGTLPEPVHRRGGGRSDTRVVGSCAELVNVIRIITRSSRHRRVHTLAT